MIRNNNLGALMGAPVLGKDDERIGTVGQVFVDPVTDEPNWMTVHTGLFGRRETFVPLKDAEWDHERLRVDIDKETIKAAPRIDTDEALSPEDEENLYRYYAVQAAGGNPETDHVAETDQVAETDHVAVEHSGRDERPGRLKRYVVADRDPAAPDDTTAASTDSSSDDTTDGTHPRHAKTD
jgi:hypothetical protein